MSRDITFLRTNLNAARAATTADSSEVPELEESNRFYSVDHRDSCHEGVTHNDKTHTL